MKKLIEGSKCSNATSSGRNATYSRASSGGSNLGPSSFETGDVWAYDFEQDAFRSLLHPIARTRRKRK